MDIIGGKTRVLDIDSESKWLKMDSCLLLKRFRLKVKTSGIIIISWLKLPPSGLPPSRSSHPIFRRGSVFFVTPRNAFNGRSTPSFQYVRSFSLLVSITPFNVVVRSPVLPSSSPLLDPAGEERRKRADVMRGQRLPSRSFRVFVHAAL